MRDRRELDNRKLVDQEVVVDQVIKFLKFYRDNNLTLDQVIEVLEYDRGKQLFPG